MTKQQSKAAAKAAKAAAAAADKARADAAAAGKSEEEQNAAAEAAAAAAASAASTARVEVRVLTACQYGQGNDVVSLAGADLEDALELGVVDDDPAAVAYAKSLQA